MYYRKKSIISDSTLLDKNPYLPQLEIPTSSRIERYPQIAVWPEFEAAAIDAVTKVLTGKSATKAAMDALNDRFGKNTLTKAAHIRNNRDDKSEDAAHN